MKIIRLLPVVFALLTLSTQAAVVPGRWDKVEALEVGTPIVVKLKSGDQFEGVFADLRPGDLVIHATPANERIFARESVKEVRRQERFDDGIGDGLLLGAELRQPVLSSWWPEVSVSTSTPASTTWRQD